MSIYEYNEAEHMRMEREDAYEDGSTTGQNRVLELLRRMSEDDMSEQLEKVAKDPEFFQEMLNKYELK